MSTPAQELLQWADAPRKKLKYMAGYQRELDVRRTANIRKFIEQSPANILPSSVIVAARSDCVHVSAADEASGACSVEIEWSETRSPDAARASLLKNLLARLNEHEKQSIGALERLEEETSDAIETEEEEADDLDLPPASYLAALASELQNFETLEVSRQEEIDEHVRMLAKPGLIIDGQHRVFGAKDVVDFPVQIPVVFLPGLSMQEQVFHFYILNNKAKPLDKTQLRSIVSTSLSNGEIEALYDRFDSAGLDAEEARWTHEANTIEGSPFKGLISFGLGEETSALKEPVADQLMRHFVKMPPKFRALFSDVEKWKDYEYRLELFFAFWRAVKDTYPEAWEKATKGEGQLFRKVGLLVLQDYVLETLKSVRAFQDESPFASGQSLYEAVQKALSRLPEAFFLREWKVKSLDTRDGHAFVLDQMQKVVSKDGKDLGRNQLFKGA